MLSRDVSIVNGMVRTKDSLHSKRVGVKDGGTLQYSYGGYDLWKDTVGKWYIFKNDDLINSFRTEREARQAIDNGTTGKLNKASPYAMWKAEREKTKDSKTKDASTEWKVKITGKLYKGNEVTGEITKTVILPGNESYRNRDIVANQLRDELLRKYPLTEIVDFKVISVNGREWNPGGSRLSH